VAFAAGLPFGITGVAATYLFASLVVQPVFTAITARTVGLTLRQCVASIAGPLQAGILMMLLVLAGRELLLALGMPVLGRLVTLIALGVIAYIPLVAWRAPEVRHELRAVMQRQYAPSAGPEPTEASA
jgi:threonine/homoserine/homoserine lactone efflux protein